MAGALVVVKIGGSPLASRKIGTSYSNVM